MEGMISRMSEEEIRLNKILSAIDEMKSVISGRAHSFVPYTHTEEKKLSKEKVAALIQRLLACGQEKEGGEKAAFSEQVQQVYGSYLYCAISYCACYFQEEHMTFESILMMTEDFLLLKFRQMLLDHKQGYFPEDKDLERHFRNYCILFDSDYDFPDFEYDIWYMLNRFLYREGLSLYGQEEYYLEAVECIRSAAKKLKEVSQKQMKDRDHGTL